MFRPSDGITNRINVDKDIQLNNFSEKQKTNETNKNMVEHSAVLFIISSTVGQPIQSRSLLLPYHLPGGETMATAF